MAAEVMDTRSNGGAVNGCMMDGHMVMTVSGWVGIYQGMFAVHVD